MPVAWLQVAAQLRSDSEIIIRCFPVVVRTRSNSGEVTILGSFSTDHRAVPAAGVPDANRTPETSVRHLQLRSESVIAAQGCNASAFPAADADAAPNKQKSVINHRRGEAQVAPPGGCVGVNVQPP
ncbi:hypothetical protein PC116_g26184 [Phytophthora cactorum]|uniref:Uncharacterized protein n=1 Tax=Phytophthora cactorum TaxID=29920 RepID=A0A8T1JTS9_9STRA|nr:hypothetical protein Pcac1_g22948 [Phytophthora cactorum]KAG2876029.1 hypothetical protein PC114_g24404 [Phytophthora cactorum]KAG2891410.1 hypothetical protein PC117_g24250 [Phytophthora cactorum]KAG2969354.1 hypothetical protein PC119_g23937 [Phytophthora cactorum]KAG2987095.1 hypothetical protein PC120_g23684 [Phytophthora cactorum]